MGIWLLPEKIDPNAAMNAPTMNAMATASMNPASPTIMARPLSISCMNCRSPITQMRHSAITTLAFYTLALGL